MSASTITDRVKSGCATCRIRRVKCDEQKPECHRCVSTGRKCDGYSILPFSRRDFQQAASVSTSRQASPSYQHQAGGIIPRLVTDPAFEDLLEKRYFQFFRQKTIASTNSTVDSRFWDRTILQACHSEPTIKYAVLALSSLHQLSCLPPGSETSLQHRRYAEKQHQKALEAARSLIASAGAEDIDRILSACVIFIIFEGVRGDYQAASTHMDSGRAIVAQNTQRYTKKDRRKDLAEIEQTLARLDLSAICFSDYSSPYKYTLTEFYESCPSLTPGRFEDVGEAQASFINLCRWLFLIGFGIENEELNGDMPTLAKYQVEKIKCSELIEEWHCHFEEVVARAVDKESPVIPNLRCWYAVVQVTCKSERYGPETRYDRFTYLFEEILRHAKQVSDKLLQGGEQAQTFSYDFGFLVPLYLCATRCRDPLLRRRAIALLRSHPRQEGVWGSTAAAAVAEQWVAVEEEGLGTVTCAADVPEHKRTKEIETTVNLTTHTVYMELKPRHAVTSKFVTATWESEWRA